METNIFSTLTESETRISLEGHHNGGNISTKIRLHFLSTIGHGDQ